MCSAFSADYVLGSSKTYSITFDVVNVGEPAYLSQINVTSSNRMPFARIPSSCSAIEFVLVCDLYKGQPMLENDKESLTILFDVSNIEGTDMKIIAEVFSSGNELNATNNIIVNTIKLTEISYVQVVPYNNWEIISLEDTKSNCKEFINKLDISNIGPSIIPILMPIVYVLKEDDKFSNVVDFQNIAIEATYSGYSLNVEYTRNRYLDELPITQLSTNSSFEEFLLKNVQSIIPFNPNRTIFFNCRNLDQTICYLAKIRVNNFNTKNNIQITIKYPILLNETKLLLVKKKEFLIITTDLILEKVGNQTGYNANLYTFM